MTHDDDRPARTLELGGHRFPGMWRELLPEDFPYLVPPREARATCADCYQVALGRFAAGCQCCTYEPQIANFMVGMALKDPASRDPMRARIEAGGALPRELAPSPVGFRRSIALHADERFGRDHEALCPFFDGETTDCRIYPYRNSVCSTFTCVHDHGEAGEYYWERLQQLVGHVELAVSQWVLDKLGFGHDTYVERLDGLADRVGACSDPVGGLWSEEARRWMWGDLYGLEVGFFERCADVVLEHRDLLYTVARDTRLRHALRFERAVRDWMPGELREVVPAIADDEYAAEGIPSLYYKVQLATRSLWQLPFGGGAVALAAGAVLEENPGDDPASRLDADRPYRVRVGDVRSLLDADEHAALALFAEPRWIDERLLARAEIEALAEPREALAVWLRRGVLVEQGG